MLQPETLFANGFQNRQFLAFRQTMYTPPPYLENSIYLYAYNTQMYFLVCWRFINSASHIRDDECDYWNGKYLEEIVKYFQRLFQNLYGGTEENHVRPRKGRLTSGQMEIKTSTFHKNWGTGYDSCNCVGFQNHNFERLL